MPNDSAVLISALRENVRTLLRVPEISAETIRDQKNKVAETKRGGRPSACTKQLCIAIPYKKTPQRQSI